MQMALVSFLSQTKSIYIINISIIIQKKLTTRSEYITRWRDENHRYRHFKKKNQKIIIARDDENKTRSQKSAMKWAKQELQIWKEPELMKLRQNFWNIIN